MTVRLALLLLSLTPGAAAAADLCADRASNIEPEMRIQEADLSTRAAQEAVVALEDLIVDEAPDELTEFAMLNRLQVLRGYTLRQQALEDRAAYGEASPQAAASIEAFCAWWTEEAFWYD